ncbi:hypothetical protein [Leptospira ellisii]|uniref:hypothetical protein n=2 Tax=Leptospira ellisii TaxID=2023197 RepID=UPI00374EF807
MNIRFFEWIGFGPAPRAKSRGVSEKRGSLRRIPAVLIAVLLSVSVLSQNCVRPEVVTPKDSQSQIYAAASFLANKCGTPIPVPFPIVVDDVQQKNLDLCTIAITKSECPFVSYPFACVLIYVDKPLDDVPWYLNFQEVFIKNKI